MPGPADGPADGAGADGAGADVAPAPQRPLGERRRRRQAERAGRVDLDASMADWPDVEPPTAPRPVVRPVRPSQPGVATAPVTPTPSAMVVGPLLEARRAAVALEEQGPGRRPRRRGGEVAPTAAGAAADAGTASSATAEPDAGATRPDPPPQADDPSAVGPSAVEPSAVEPSVVEPSVVGRDVADPDDGGPRGTDARRLGAHEGEAPEAQPRVVGAGDVGSTGASGATVLSATPGGRDADRPNGGLSSRRTRLVVGAAVLVVLLVVALLVGLLRDRGADAASGASGDAAAQQTMVLTVSAPAGGLAAGALPGVDASRVPTLLLPADVLPTVADAGEARLAQAVALGASQDSTDRQRGRVVADALGPDDSAPKVSPGSPVGTDVIAVVGADLAPLPDDDQTAAPPQTPGDAP